MGQAASPHPRNNHNCRPTLANAATTRSSCACFGIGESTLREAIAKSANSVEGLGIQLKAGTNCGSCIPEPRQLLTQSGQDKSEQAIAVSA